MCLLLLLGASLAGCVASEAESAPKACPSGQIAQGDTCIPAGTSAFTRKQVADALKKYKLNAVMAGVWVDGKRVTTVASGESMTGVPVSTDMHFRIGSVAIPYLTTEILKLVDEGKVKLDDKISRWRPDLPHADEITLKMLASTTSGYSDYVQDRTFLAELYKNPFREWTAGERVKIAVSKPLVKPPGTGFVYSHANWVILGDIISKVEKKPLAEVMRNDILKPLGLTQTDNPSTAEIPPPVLHAFDNERRVFEDSTYWNPSWTLAPGAIMTGTLEDLGKSVTALGEGKLLTPESHKEQITPVSKVSSNTSYALGLAVQNTWLLQNPSFAGYQATVAYLPSKKITIATVGTQGIGNNASENFSTALLVSIANHVAPDMPLSGD
ncbi:beta-lactamase family protein [Streptomyces sp. NBC_01142]|uniref:serine hydrolase domain-containing protein n=1 Tax=Streptomyces sp. NBC_01142 TaxID=2975865 RepID=UPI00225B65D8|nr:serine hydrolase domain-containing protein [Streptomyces sp. NBC_01142]MCX4821019.1 beta-lactamase family protein [Streptomyces sp. NBC_01142]